MVVMQVAERLPEPQGPESSLTMMRYCLVEYCPARSWKNTSHLIPEKLTLLIDIQCY